MSKNVLAHEKTTEVKTMIFNSIQDLYRDLLSNQSFIVSQNTYHSNKAIIEGCTIYRHVKLRRGKLHFHGNKFGGSELSILGNVLSIKKINNANACISEYQLTIDGLVEPFIFTTYKKSQR